MKKVFSIITIAFTLSLNFTQVANAQSVSSETVYNELKGDIMVGIRRLLLKAGEDFESIRGNKISKREDGSLVYAVKGFDEMHTESHYILVNSTSPLGFYFAYYGEDSKALAISLQAFIEMDNPMKVEKDKELSTDGKLVYSMYYMGMKIGVYTMDEKKSEGTMLIGAL